MFGEINRRFNKAKRDAEEHRFIVESTLEVEEVLPGSEDEYDDEIDVDSVPEDVYKEIDKKLDELISKGDYDDEEIEEMMDDDDDVDDDEFDIKVEEVVNEGINTWIMNEDPSYGSGENVDIQNKTGDEKDGCHVDTEIPEPDCPVKANKDMEHGEDLYDFSGDNRKPSNYQEGDHVKTEEADFETTEEAKKAMHESAIGSLRAMLEDASYGSGERVEIQNRTGDYQEGDHVKTEEPDFETTSDAKRDFNKGEDLYDYDQGSDSGLGYREGDHADMETKNPITNESTLSIYRSLVEGYITPNQAYEMLEEGAIVEKWRAAFSPEMKKLKKNITELKKIARTGEKKEIDAKKKECKEHVKNMRKIVDDIPDDNLGSWLSRIFLTTIPDFIIGLANINTEEGAKQTIAQLTPMVIASIFKRYLPGSIALMIKAAAQGDSLSEVSRNDMHRILDGLEEAIDNV